MAHLGFGANVLMPRQVSSQRRAVERRPRGANFASGGARRLARSCDTATERVAARRQSASASALPIARPQWRHYAWASAAASHDLQHQDGLTLEPRDGG